MSLPFQQDNNKLLWSPGPLYGRDDQVEFGKCHAEEKLDSSLQSCEPIEKFLESTSQVNNKPSTSDDFKNGSKDCYGQEDGSVPDSVQQYLVPLSLIERWGDAMGILLQSHLLTYHFFRL